MGACPVRGDPGFAGFMFTPKEGVQYFTPSHVLLGRWKAVYEASTMLAELWETAQRLRRNSQIRWGMASAVRGRVCPPGLWAEDAWQGVQGADA